MTTPVPAPVNNKAVIAAATALVLALGGVVTWAATPDPTPTPTPTATPTVSDTASSPAPSTASPTDITPSPTLTSATPTPTVGKPDASNTGPRIPLTPYNGPSPLRLSGVTYTGVDLSAVTGVWTVSNVSFIDCKLPTWLGLLKSSNVTVSHSVGSRIQFDGVTTGLVENTNLSAFSDDPLQVFSSHAMNSNITIRGNYVHDGGPYTNHIDGIQVRGGDGVSITGNYFDIPYVATSATGYVNSVILIDAPGTTGGNRNIVVTGNWLLGGGYTFRLGNPTPGNVTLTNNRFAPGHWGPYINHTGGVTQLEHSTGNVWDATGLPVPQLPVIP